MKGKRIISLVAISTMIVGLFTGIVGKSVNAETKTTEGINNRKVIGYFPEWAFEQESHEKYTVDKMPWDKLTHINYAFAIVNPQTNKIDFGDKSAAIEKEFPGQTSEFSYKGHFNVLSSYKKKYPNVNVIISVGGWAGSTGFYTMCETAQGRETFANSCIEFIRTYGFDGVDIDYEYPTSTPEAGNPIDSKLAGSRRSTLYSNYCEMMKVLREKIDKASTEDNKKYILSAAIPASSWILGGMGVGEYAKYLDYVNMMTYDFHGAWNGYVGPQSALYPDSRDPETQGFPMPVLNIDWAYRYFRGVLPPEKINIGVPYYTRGWKNVSPSGNPGGLYGNAWLSRVPGQEKGDGAVGIENLWHDLDANGNEEPSGSNPLWHVKNLLNNPDYKYYYDDVTKTPYIWNESKKVFLTYEDEKSIQAKLDYMMDKNIGGIMIWELDGDYGVKSDGKYGVGNTLTTYINDFMKKASPLVPKIDDGKLPPSMNYAVEFSGKYDHPNYDFKMLIKNNTTETIAKGWTLSFDLPKSAYVEKVYTGTIDKGVPNGDFTRYTITSPSWGDINPGASLEVTGVIKLCFSGGAKNFTLNGFSSQSEVGKVDPDESVLPLKPEVKTSSTESKDGNYDVNLSIPSNSRATSYKIYEGDKVVKSAEITGTSAQTITYSIKNKAKGSYNYKAELINKYGSVSSNTIAVNVTREDGGGQTSQDLDVKFKVSSDWGTGGQYDITLTNKGLKAIKSWIVELDFPITITSSWNCNFQSLGNGRYRFSSATTAANIDPGKSISLSGACMGGALGKEAYNIVSSVVYVDGDTGGVVTPTDPKLQAPAISVDKATNNGDYNLSIKVPKNNTGTSLKIYENNAVIHEVNLTANDSTDKIISVNKKGQKAGSYEYKAIISDSKGNLESNKITVTVQDEVIPDVAQWGLLINYRAGDLVKYNNVVYECRLPHLSLNGWEPPNVPALWLKK